MEHIKSKRNDERKTDFYQRGYAFYSTISCEQTATLYSIMK